MTEPILIQKNIKFAEDPRLDAITPKESVSCHHIDHERDEILGYPLSQFNLNYRFDPKDERDIVFQSALPTSTLPSSASLRSQWGTILDQGQIGSCVSNAVAYQLRFLNNKCTPGVNVDFSRLFIYYNGRVISGEPIIEDTGLSLRAGYQSVATDGAPLESSWPYIISQFTVKPPAIVYSSAIADKNIVYYSVAQDANVIKKCIVDGFAVSFGMILCDSFMSLKVAQTGIVPIPTNSEQRVGGHAMNIIGYNDTTQTFECSNQWGKNWGDVGICHIPYQLILDSNTTSDLWTPRVFSFKVPTPAITPAPTPAPKPTPTPTPAPAITPSTVVSKWGINIHYNICDKVTYLGYTFICLITHRSIAAWNPPAIPIIWKLVQ